MMRSFHSNLRGGLRLFCGLLLVLAAAGGPTSISSVSLASSANPALIGQPVTITASVTAAATGQVAFYDGAAMLGSATIATGQAKISTRLLPAGVHTLRAHYGGDGSYLPSDSAPLIQTITALPANNFQQILTTPVETGPLLVGDFNGDGKSDVLFVNYQSVDVLLGKGDGTFQNPVSTPNGSNGNGVAAGDFTGDGIPDVALVTSSGPFSGVLILMPGKGDGTFRTGVSYQLNVSPMSVAVADFNGDGKADVMVSGFGLGGPNFSVLLGNGDGTVQPPMTYSIAGGSAVVGDFNGDGKPDLAFGGGPLIILLGNGDGTFRGPVTEMNLSNTNSLVAADLNGDGKVDLAGVGQGVSVWLGNGDGTFQQPWNGAAPTYIGNAAAGDFNGDGKTDLAVVGGAAGVGIWAGSGDGKLQQPVIYDANNVYARLAAGEFNGDGRSDLVGSQPQVIVYLGTTAPDLTIAESHTGTFAPGSSGETIVITVGNAPYAPTSGPVVVTDLLPPGLTASGISGTGWTCTLATLMCTRNDSLAPGASYPAITIAVAVSGMVPGSITNIASVSGGGMPAPSKRASDTILTRTTTIFLAFSPATATLGQPVTLTATLNAGATGQVTFYDGASVLGISAVSGVTWQAVLVTRTMAAGTHMLRARYDPDATSLWPPAVAATPFPETVLAVPANGFQAGVAYPASSPASSMALADFNGDGRMDMAVAGGSTVALLSGNGDGTFRGPANSAASPAGTTILALMTADFNGDGKPDLVAGYQDSMGGGVSVLLGNGDGTFQPPAFYTIGMQVSVLAVADFNSDGAADIAFASPYAPTIHFLFGKGNGIFQLPASYNLDNPLNGNLLTADLNGDGKADLVFSTYNGIAVQLGNGDGTFQPAMNFANGSCCGSGPVFLADFNGDGKPDAAVLSGPQFAILFGNGDGTFQAARFTTVPVAGLILSATDVNGDGKADLIAAGGGPSIVQQLGNGDGTFQPPVTLATAGIPASAAVGDFNGDGRADVAVANGASGNVSVLLGGSFTPPTRINLTVWRPANGTWYVNPSNKLSFSQQWGLPGDIPVTADFDHDGQLDYAVWRPSQGNWFVSLSSNPGIPLIRQWGLAGDIPVPGDYDGDGLPDYAVWRPANGLWFIETSGSGFNASIVRQWGLPNDVPVVADFDGDRRMDYAVWRPANGTWYVVSSLTGSSMQKQWGLPGDVPVAADFDGDGRADYAVWRPAQGNWYIVPSGSGIPYVVQWGLNGDIPVPRDYDGDGKADLAVWRPANGTWYIMPSGTAGASLTVQWGLAGDVPVYKPSGN